MRGAFPPPGSLSTSTAARTCQGWTPKLRGSRDPCCSTSITDHSLGGATVNIEDNLLQSRKVNNSHPRAHCLVHRPDLSKLSTLKLSSSTSQEKICTMRNIKLDAWLKRYWYPKIPQRSKFDEPFRVHRRAGHERRSGTSNSLTWTSLLQELLTSGNIGANEP